MKGKEGDGWILIDRKIREHWIYTEKPVSRFQAWIDLILSANYRDKTIMVNGHPYVIPRGSFLTSTRKLAERWGWSKNKVSRFLGTLQRDGMIKTGTQVGTLITIEKYGFYQTRRDTKRDTRGTATGQRRDSDGLQEKERRKKEKEGKRKEKDSDDDGMTPDELDQMLKERNGNGTV